MNYDRLLKALAVEIDADTAHSSRTKDAMMHPCFALVVALGMQMAHALLRRVRDVGGWWEMMALRRIIGDGPSIPEADRGKHDCIRNHWLTWANEQEIPWSNQATDPTSTSPLR